MNKNKINLNKKESKLIEKLRKHPELLERFEAIMELAGEDTDERVKTADQVESLLIEEIRKLGNQTLCCWAENAEEKVAQEVMKEHTGIKQREKKTKVVDNIRRDSSDGTHMAK